ncbi:universal stress protein [Cyanobacterium stanieri LEGE 03274]|uniref:Universal stress protein n=1 Tax=Cyanobacterium stanieri LEGE 03274 TaxID=1828756 RepID=A0ABR9V847_9CHRO|nr:universal stress protein [Cyanobacterium stanieri]MBE9223719.1 universal stress protein [Cyanobacterium stanieri LEGE 03274]
MRNILLCTDGSSYGENSYKYTAWIAKRLGIKQVDVLSVTDNRARNQSSQGNWSGSLSLGASDELLEKLVELDHQRAKLNHVRAKVILDHAKEMLTREGIEDVNSIHRTGFVADTVKDLEPETDLIVLGKRGENAEYNSIHLGANLERIVRVSSKPCFVTPRDFYPIDRVLIAYDDSATSSRILNFLRENPFIQDLEVHMVMVNKSDSDGGAKLDRAVTLLNDANFTVQFSLLKGEEESAIASYIEQHKINLLIMGAYGHSRIRNLIIGSTTIQLLRSTRIPALLFR